MAKGHSKPKFMKLKKVEEIYDINARTCRDMCLKDLRMKKSGTPEEGPFRGRSVKLGLKWFVPVAELERLFREGMV